MFKILKPFRCFCNSELKNILLRSKCPRGMHLSFCSTHGFDLKCEGLTYDRPIVRHGIVAESVKTVDLEQGSDQSNHFNVSRRGSGFKKSRHFVEFDLKKLINRLVTILILNVKKTRLKS